MCYFSRRICKRVSSAQRENKTTSYKITFTNHNSDYVKLHVYCNLSDLKYLFLYFTILC